MHHFKLKILDEVFSIHRLSLIGKILDKIYQSTFYSVTKTDDELSVVCESRIRLSAEKTDAGWKCIKILEKLDFSLTGVLSKISTVLANAEISIFTVSTYDTDYILVKASNIMIAKQVLVESGYFFED